jgi:Fe-S-cluster containining protein
MDAEKIACMARKSIGQFCIEDCKAYCCRKGYLVMKNKQLELILGNAAEDIDLKINFKKLDSNNISLFLGNGCPCLLPDFKCKIYKKKNRPIACNKFPLILDTEKKIIKMSNRCPAVKLNMMFPFVKKLMGMGYTIVNGSELADTFYNLEFK